MRDAILFVFLLVDVKIVRGFITRGDHEFTGEDPKLMAELKRRMPSAQVHRPPPGHYIAGKLQKEVRLTTRFDYEMQNKMPKRRSPEWYITEQYAGEANENHVYQAQLRAMHQSIYSSQFRLKEMEYVLKKYEGDMRFKIAFIFKKLDEWRHEMNLIYQHVTSRLNNNAEHFRVVYNIVYYTNLARRNIDIGYTIEYLIQVNEEIKKTIVKNDQFAQFMDEGFNAAVGK